MTTNEVQKDFESGLRQEEGGVRLPKKVCVDSSNFDGLPSALVEAVAMLVQGTREAVQEAF